MGRFLTLKKFFDIIFIEKMRKETKIVVSELIKALLTIQNQCAESKSCKDCPLKDFCGRPVSEWAKQ